MKILVVDDNPDHRFLTKRALAPLHMDIDMASGGEEALRRCTADGVALPDLVLLDIKMPGLDGFEVLKRLRAAPATRGVRVVVFSSSENAQDVERARKAGADDFVTKPLDARAFVEVVRATVAKNI